MLSEMEIMSTSWAYKGLSIHPFAGQDVIISHAVSEEIPLK